MLYFQEELTNFRTSKFQNHLTVKNYIYKNIFHCLSKAMYITFMKSPYNEERKAKAIATFSAYKINAINRRKF